MYYVGTYRYLKSNKFNIIEKAINFCQTKQHVLSSLKNSLIELFKIAQ